MSTSTITANQVRAALLARIDGYLATTGMSASALGKAAAADDRFVKRIRDGGNFTVETYQKVIDWLDAQERERAA
jgi:hypothetical protein